MPDVTPDSQGILNVSLTMRMVYQRAQQTYMNWHPPPRVGPPVGCLMRGCEFVHVCFGSLLVRIWTREYGFGEHGFKHRAQWVFCPPQVPGRELSEFLSAYYLHANANSPSSRRTHRVCPQTQRNPLSSETVLSKQYHSGQNVYIHKFLFWAVISEYVKTALHKQILADLDFEYVENSFADRNCFGSEYL